MEGGLATPDAWRPLARALFKLDVDTEIPAEHYQAVAEIIAFVWRARSRRVG